MAEVRPMSGTDHTGQAPEKGHRRRLRERFRAVGRRGFADHEMLELLLTYAVPRRDTKPLAKALMRSFGSIAGVLDQPAEKLEAIAGLGPDSSTLVGLVRSCVERYFEHGVTRAKRIEGPDDIARFVRARLGPEQRECVVMLCLNDDNRLIHHAIVVEGTANRVVLYPREIVREALLHNATGMILVHNHPAGDAVPSEEDHRLTKRIRDVAEQLDIRFLDHLIVGAGRTFSLLTGKSI
jgi:DNA repair protein RadC